MASYDVASNISRALAAGLPAHAVLASVAVRAAAGAGRGGPPGLAFIARHVIQRIEPSFLDLHGNI